MLSEAKPDFIDLNAGCPVKKVCKRNGGAALLKDPDALGRLVEGMAAAASVPLTVKIRSSQTIGHECPSPGIRVFQRIFLDCPTSH